MGEGMSGETGLFCPPYSHRKGDRPNRSATTSRKQKPSIYKRQPDIRTTVAMIAERKRKRPTREEHCKATDGCNCRAAPNLISHSRHFAARRCVVNSRGFCCHSFFRVLNVHN